MVQGAGTPVVVLNLQPVGAMGDRGRMTGEWLAHCQACAAPEIASVFNRARIDYHLVTGTLDDTEAWAEIDAWVDAARLVARLRDARVGVLGHCRTSGRTPKFQTSGILERMRNHRFLDEKP